ncbi:phage replisome organizer N-terminal domain-containing protein [Anaerococcus hydrogenalis]|uniref:phage replisome organizer N-terminal domain-containing protein n=1 Tax=Anaerococcus hydrogenalis TaxID=33029 RepID=UPI001E17782F|nr:phage replisome organizer N-terminal domain-containing protein [Anaerococcus hydrogenalis]MBS5988882.1 phage replisome organizer N-terminal domain-containing protein [Anaerococcus hydrogenalis]
MSDNKRYYWLKLPEDFYDDDTIQWIEDQENGAAYVNFYLKLLLKSLSDEGRLIRYVGQRLIPYDVKSLSRLTNTDTDTVRVALELFVKIGLIERLDTGEIYMSQIDEMIGSETQAATRMRKMRARKALKSDNQAEKQEIDDEKRNNVTGERNNVQKCYTDNRDKIIDKDIEIDKRDNNNISKNFNDEEKITVDYYYRLVKNNTSKSDIDLVVNAINQYGWKKIFYTLWYLKNEQKANITSFKYVDKVLSSQKELDMGVVDFVVNREMRNIKCASLN